MDSNEDTSTFGISILDIQKQEKEKERKKKNAEKMKRYFSRPEVKERIFVKKMEKKMAEEFRNLGKINPHKICKKLGSAMNIRTKDGEILYKCKVCDVSYKKEQEKYFWRNHYCPCCHRKLRTRKPTQWKKIKHNKK